MTYWSIFERLSQNYQAANYEVASLYSDLSAVRTRLKHGSLPLTPVPKLTLSEEAWYDFVTINRDKGTDEYKLYLHLLANFRKYCQYHTGVWSLSSLLFWQYWQRYYRPRQVLEVMAGQGVLSRTLTQLGIPVISTDDKSWVSQNETGRHSVYPVKVIPALKAIQYYGHQVSDIIVSWSPDHDPIDEAMWHMWKRYAPHTRLWIMGERFGVTNSFGFWLSHQPNFDVKLAKLNRLLPKIDVVHETLYLYHDR